MPFPVQILSEQSPARLVLTCDNHPVSQRVLLPLVFFLLGVVLLAYSAWSRHGGSRAARHWVSEPPTENWMLERIVILGAPAAGLALWSVAAIFLFQDLTILRNLAIAALTVLLIPLLYFMVAVIPIPLLLYPRWAREVVRGRRQFWRDVGARRR